MTSRSKYQPMLCEIRGSLSRKAGQHPNLVPLRYRSLSGERFRSYFGYPRAVAQNIQEQDNTKNLRGVPVYSDMIFIDVDEDMHVNYVRNVLRSIGMHFIEFSARRGRHFHVPIEAIYGPDVPYSLKLWLLSYFDPEHVDLSMLHPAGQIRLAGAVHQKDGSIKRILGRYPGRLLSIPIRPAPKPVIIQLSDVDIEQRWRRNEVYTELIREPKGEGGRYPHLYKIIANGMIAGINPDVILRHLQWWNQGCKPPHTSEYIKQAAVRVMKHIGSSYG